MQLFKIKGVGGALFLFLIKCLALILLNLILFGSPEKTPENSLSVACSHEFLLHYKSFKILDSHSNGKLSA